jgi:rhodanese-related sulfurtransferase
MKNHLLFIALLTTLVSCVTQKTIPEVIERFNKNSVDYISVAELKEKKEVTLFDAREKVEFDVSHIKDGVNVGYSNFNPKAILQKYPDKNSEIIVYCSLGIRSENIGEKLQKLGYTNVKNLYGGIFEWKNEGNSLTNNEGQTTNEVHAFSKMWGKYLKKGIKIYKK